MKNKQIKIFTDGSCIKNPGPGGYASIIQHKNYTQIFKAGYKITTNNRMELMAAIIPLEKIKNKYNIQIYTDSKYIQLGITKWIKNWKQQNWKNSKKIEIKNIDLWKRLDKITKNYIIQWNWIKSHNGQKNNEYCDKLAKMSAKNPIYIDIGYK
ncbi:MAG: ribonuclease HI [Candidatus Westeberhardia cardiocondylae]|nr:ribonuclease HI [Candidatus Westeberhardia cardiocondylae]